MGKRPIGDHFNEKDWSMKGGSMKMVASMRKVASMGNESLNKQSGGSGKAASIRRWRQWASIQ